MDLIDQLYEAAVAPELFASALGAARPGLAGQASVLLFRGQAKPTTVGYNVPPKVWRDFASGTWARSPAVSWALGNGHVDFTPFTERFTPDELALDPAVAQLYDVGLGDCLTSMLSLGDGGMAGFMFARARELGPYTPDEVRGLNALQPHLARSLLVATRLEMERARSTVDALNRLGLAAAVIDVQARVIASNAQFDGLTGVVIPTAFGGLALGDRLGNEQFRLALSRAAAVDEGPSASIPLPGDETRGPAIVHLLPVCGQARDIFTSGHVLMVVSPVGRRDAPDAALLHGLFDLTAAEARLCLALLEGGPLPRIAARMGLSVHTVRIQLRAVMAKTGVHRQTELMRLLATI